VRLGEVVNPDAAHWGKQLSGVRILALEQMQALPYATQLLGRLGAEVVKVESPGTGDLGRTATPAMTDPDGRAVGATFLRNNLSKRSVVIDLKQPAGRDLVLRLAPRYDVVAENFRAGAIERLGLGNDDVAAHPAVVYLSISGFGHPVPAGTPASPYAGWPALASTVEAMSRLRVQAARGTNRRSARPWAASATSSRRCSPSSVIGPRCASATALLVEHPRPDGVAQPVLIPGLPVKFADVAEGPDAGALAG
jgi:crotonobetainyl-CoA:carnitine CoA-transferase CaiB-like acyl-CoA transferase